MIAGLPAGAWLLLGCAVGLGLAVQLGSFFWWRRRSRPPPAAGVDRP